VNLRIYYWFDSGTHSPARINSALLRQTKNALLQGGIELPDPAREVVFPKGVPITQFESGPGPDSPARPAVSADPGLRAHVSDDARDATVGEGNLSSETKEVARQSESTVPEAKENLLKK
jgi:hypothetical protein